MEIDVYPYELKFKYPFKIAHTLRTSTKNVYLRLKTDDVIAWGEAVFPPYVKESQESFTEFIQQVKFPENIKSLDVPTFASNLLEQHPNSYASVAAVEMALYKCKALLNNQPWLHYNKERCYQKSSFTIGMGSKDEMKAKINDHPQASYYKLKVDQDSFERVVSDYLHLSKKPFVVDANQGFRNPLAALEACNRLKRLGVAYIEQPFEKGDFASHRWLKERSPIPIIADESFQNYDDLKKVKTSFDGVNIKLMKCGGITQAQRILDVCIKENLRTVIGCMSGSSVAIEAAWQLHKRVDWVDLDGPLLINNDPFLGNEQEPEIIDKLKGLSVKQ